MVTNPPRDWRKLCEAASKEKDPDKLTLLVAEIIDVLEERDRNCSAASGREKDRVSESQ